MEPCAARQPRPAGGPVLGEKLMERVVKASTTDYVEKRKKKENDTASAVNDCTPSAPSAREGWEDGTPPHRDFKERSVVAVAHPWASTTSYLSLFAVSR